MPYVHHVQCLRPQSRTPPRPPRHEGHAHRRLLLVPWWRCSHTEAALDAAGLPVSWNMWFADSGLGLHALLVGLGLCIVARGRRLGGGFVVLGNLHHRCAQQHRLAITLHHIIPPLRPTFIQQRRLFSNTPPRHRPLSSLPQVCVCVCVCVCVVFVCAQGGTALCTHCPRCK